MCTSLESCHDLDLGEGEAASRESVYSPASSFSTYSHEVKYIFNPGEDNVDEYGDYSHITPRVKQNYMSHTPRTLSASSQMSGKENRTPHSSGEEPTFADPAQRLMAPRTGSVLSSTSRDRGPISPHMEEVLYPAPHYAYGPASSPRKPSGPLEYGLKDRAFFSPSSDVPAYPYAKHAYPVWKQKNINNNPNPPGWHLYQAMAKHSSFNQDTHPAVRNTLNTFHNQVPLNNVHNYHHYQQPHIHSSQQQQHYALPSQGYILSGQEPPYPMAPRFNHQQHSRRKTWSPPALKMSLMNAGSQSSRVCHSNDSLDISQESSLERKTQSLSEDLDVTPPKLAPISGVLSQQPGPNLIKPIAFKPIQGNPVRSPISQGSRRQPGSGDHGSGSHDSSRPLGMKLASSMLGIHGSPDSQHSRSNVGAFNSTAKPHPTTGPFGHGPAGDGSVSSCQNQATGSYINLPAIHNLSATSSHMSSGDESSLCVEFLRPSLNVNRVCTHAVESSMLQTPSPSDSGVGELEAMLREKDAEINTLREVMDRNERAIFQVYEERRNVWLHDTQELRDDYERKLKIQSRKSYKTEQVLSLQVYKLQQEQKSLQEEKTKPCHERDSLKQQLEESQSQINLLKVQLEAAAGASESRTEDGGVPTPAEGSGAGPDGSSRTELSLQEELALKNKELIHLKSQLHSFEADLEKKKKEMAEKVRELSGKTEQIKSLKEEVQRLKDPPVLVEAFSQTHVTSEVTASENVKPSMLGERDRTISSLQEELMELRTQVALMKEEHERERAQWLDEKNKVVRYQKQLQLNYVQMQRKNATLEAEVQQLTLELENRDMKLIALSGEESVC